MREGLKIFLGIVFIFSLFVIVESLFVEILLPDKSITKKKPTILLIDAVNLSQDEVGQKMIYQWISQNYERLVNEFTVKVVILSYQPGSLADYELAVRLLEWLDKKLKKEEKLILTVMSSLERGLLFASNIFRDPSVFHFLEKEKYLIFLTRYSSPADLDLEGLESGFPGVKIIPIPIPAIPEEKEEKDEKMIKI